MGANAAYIAWYISTFSYALPRPADEADPRFYRLWNMAVNVPIPNFHQTWEKKLLKTINEDIPANSQNYFKITFANFSDRFRFQQLLVKGVYCLITNTNTKVGEITRLRGDYDQLTFVLKVYVMSNILNAYTNGQAQIEFYTPNLAEKWDVGGDNPDWLQPKGLRKGLPTELISIDGKLSAQQLHLNTIDFDSSKKLYYTSLSNLQEYAASGNGLYYRLGLRYYLQYGGGQASPLEATLGSIYARLDGCNNPDKILLNYIGGSLNKYYLFNSYPAFTDWKSFENIRDTELNRQLAITFKNDSGTARSVDFGLDDIYLEHSAGFETTLGCLLLTMSPDRDSLELGSDQTEEIIKLANADRFPYFPFGNPNKSKKYSVGCTFTNSNMDTYQKLKILEMWQNDGFNLNLHTHMPEMPEVLTGRMTLGKAKKDVFDFKRVSFDFSFEEV